MNKTLKNIISKRLFLPIFCLILVLLINLITRPDFFSIEIRDGVLYGFLIDIINRASELVILAVGIAASAGVGIFYLVLFRKKRKAGKVPGDPYADRPKMHRPEMLRVMDRGLGEE